MGGFYVKATNEKFFLWEQQTKERKHNGLKIEDWCKKNDISTHHYYWNQHVRGVKRQARS
jgi:hypothetical protein